jgi:menaquinol-cytochrome c reductase iron-sulfur subunit
MGEELPRHTAAEESGVDRRSFFKVIIGVLTSLYGLILGIPYLRAVINSAPLSRGSYTEVGDIGPLGIGQPQDMNFRMHASDAFIHQEVTRSVWVIKHSEEEVTVFSPICPHLGCHYKWDPQTNHFECPCHGSVFTTTGKVIGGPAPRPLDTLPHKIENGKLYVEWERFKVGIPEKVRV